jgi:hypothetical protein
VIDAVGVSLVMGGLFALRFPVFLGDFDQWGFHINCGSGCRVRGRRPSLLVNRLPERKLMPTCVSRRASTMSAVLTSARPDRSPTVKDAVANPVGPPKGRLV